MTITTGYGDALTFDLPPNRLTITSPPYANQRRKQYGGIHPDQYAEWFLPHAEAIYNALEDDGSFILNIKENVVDGERHPYVMHTVLNLRELGFRLVDEYIWHKTTAAPGKWPNRFRDSWEHLYHFTKQKKFVFNQDDVMVPAGDWTKTRLKNLGANDTTRHESATNSGVGRNISNWKDRPLVYPSNVLHGSPTTNNLNHSATYPVWLPTFFTKLLTNPGDTILDPFAGSGTTGIAAHNHNRHATLLDNNPHSYQTMLTRLAAEGIPTQTTHPTQHLPET